MMPAFNSGETIQFSIASLVAQTYEKWECLILDDGSTDDTFIKANVIEDSRIRILRQELNLGEAATRQIALENLQGELIGMLDADDWIYPDKIAKQVEVLSSNKDVFLVSCGMAITGDGEKLMGIRATGAGKERLYTTPEKLPVAHAPSLFRNEGLENIKYDSTMRMASDSDFLRRMLLGKKFVVMPYVGYCYRELSSARFGKAIAGYYYNVRGLLKFFKAKPFPIGWQVVKEISKVLVYLVLYPLGLFSLLIKRRSRFPSLAEKEEYYRAREAVQVAYDRLTNMKTS